MEESLTYTWQAIVLGLNRLGDWLRDYLDPQGKR
jgi:ABC-type dipeptide/oligopeptide/nickel transport system permease subunit